MFGGGRDHDSTPAIWKMEYIMENRLKRLIDSSESRTNDVTEKRWRKQRKEANRRERRIKENVEKHYKSLHEELDRRQKWMDDRIESIRAPDTRRRMTSLEGLVAQLIRRVDKLEMSLRLGNSKNKNRNMFRRRYDYNEYADDEEEMDEEYEKSVLMEQAEEYRKRDLSKKKRQNRRRRRQRVTTEEEEISPIKKNHKETVRFVESPYINLRHEKPENASIMSSFNRTRQSLEDSHGRCTAALRNAGIII